MSRVIAFVLMLSAASALDHEFQGFHHFRDWDLNWASRTAFQPSLNYEIAIDVCAFSSDCGQVCCGGAYWQSLNRSNTWDVYLANDTNAAPGAICSVRAGGCNTPSQTYLNCEQDFGYGIQGHTLNHFDIPPELLHSTCVGLPQCIGMRIKNDGGGGELLCQSTLGPENPGLFKI
jgi:hypothetical protein